MENTHNILDIFNLDNVRLIIKNYCLEHKMRAEVESYNVENCSGKLLGFLSDYYKLVIVIRLKDEDTNKHIHFFIKAVSRSNKYKATIAREWKVFAKEIYYYNFLNDFEKYSVDGLKQWNSNVRAVFNGDVLVFDDLVSRGYKTRNKLKRFGKTHTMQALRTLASFHASSIIYEEMKSFQLKRPYRINQEYRDFADLGGYKMSDSWFIQCKDAAIYTLKKHSKYGKLELFKRIEEMWDGIWASAIEINNLTKYRSVLCHRDLWNNNLMFHYETNENNDKKTDDCLLVDFQGVRYQPPASDVMVLLYCNLDPTFRERHINEFLSYYYGELTRILSLNGITIENILPFELFLESAEEQRKYGLVINACLLPQNCIDDEEMVKYFQDSFTFHDTLTKNKIKFIDDLIKRNRHDYKNKLLEAFEELVERYVECIVI